MNVNWLESEDVRQQFSLELSNRFSLLPDEEFADGYGMEEEWQILKGTAMDTAEHVTGFRQGTSKEQWTSDGTWKATDERRRLKAKRKKAPEKKMEEFMEEYRQKDKEVRSHCRGHNECWFEGKLAEAEQAAVRNDSKTL